MARAAELLSPLKRELVDKARERAISTKNEKHELEALARAGGSKGTVTAEVARFPMSDLRAFEFANAAHEAVAAFAELRARRVGPAKDAFTEARRLFQQGKQDEGYAKYREIVQSHYASPLYRTVKRWLEERK